MNFEDWTHSYKDLQSMKMKEENHSLKTLSTHNCKRRNQKLRKWSLVCNQLWANLYLPSILQPTWNQLQLVTGLSRNNRSHLTAFSLTLIWPLINQLTEIIWWSIQQQRYKLYSYIRFIRFYSFPYTLGTQGRMHAWYCSLADVDGILIFRFYSYLSKVHNPIMGYIWMVSKYD